MTLALLLTTALLGQTVYEWTDAQGEAHYTDDLSSIPKGAKVRTTEGADVSVVTSGARGSRDAGASRPAPVASRAERDRCAAAKAQLAAAEERLTAAKKEHELRLARATGECQALLRTHGQGEYVKCANQRRRRPQEVPTPNFGPLEKQVEETREALRRVQVAGCFE